MGIRRGSAVDPEADGAREKHSYERVCTDAHPTQFPKESSYEKMRGMSRWASVHTCGFLNTLKAHTLTLSQGHMAHMHDPIHMHMHVHVHVCM